MFKFSHQAQAPLFLGSKVKKSVLIFAEINDICVTCVNILLGYGLQNLELRGPLLGKAS